MPPENISPAFHSISCRGRLIDLSTPKIMGILNLTPDSFSDGGKFNDKNAALKHAEEMVNAGASIIDIGAQSTRPNAEFLTSQQEIERISTVISDIKKEFPEVLISLDTFLSETVKFGFDEGIDIINDISGGQFDEKMFDVVAKTKLPYILMNINQSYNEMHHKEFFPDITLKLNQYFSKKIKDLLQKGIHDIILDPGFGFGKTVDEQMKMIDEVQFLGFGEYPLLIGISRKSFIYKPLNKSPLEINGITQKLHLKVLRQGVKILRVHDVAEAAKTVDIYLNS
ncbi:dihydropteroate synthase [Chryseobacterium sp. Leaf180]|uniref:dihydropteroate synthase n=1 Tax=Chryseobacterium sp. Leaf180 TaxID=1736289 RepID=UPI0006F2E8AE|nr:dihydropteroate synthase [Chryseobacterium sp. Leaf180]KQR92451.1 dihydropteroate synthase [Chryseobacterium sp. Leaf180]